MGNDASSSLPVSSLTGLFLSVAASSSWDFSHVHICNRGRYIFLFMFVNCISHPKTIWCCGQNIYLS